MKTINKREQDAADTISSLLNTFSFNHKEFCKAMCDEHRTLQQQFTEMCLQWIRTCASDDYRYDGRNEYSHNMCKEIVTAYDNNHTQTSLEKFDQIRMHMV